LVDVLSGPLKMQDLKMADYDEYIGKLYIRVIRYDTIRNICVRSTADDMASLV